MLTDNPYAPPQASTLNESPAATRSHWNRMLLMLPFSIVAALAGGAMNRDPGALLIDCVNLAAGVTHPFQKPNRRRSG